MNMNARVSFAIELMRKLNFPSDAIGYFKLLESGYWLSGPYAAELEQLQADYMSGSAEIRPILERLQAIAEAVGVPGRSLHQVFYLNAAAELREIYRERGIDETVFYDSVSDLKWKLLECREVRGIWGNDTYGWSNGFFMMDRFALGRLQFEKREYSKEAYTFDGVTLKPGDPVLNTHIPSAGPFPRELRYDAYRRAYAFFPEVRCGKYLPIICSSWLLLPEHDQFLDPKSNVVDFMHDFDILEVEHEEPEASWRIFGRSYQAPFEKLPRDTSLRRAYADWLIAGNKVGGARGLILFDGEKIVNNRRGE